ncbi:DUF262 domain-containing protein [Ramlibacter sp. AN1015]|uniref:DUF262 domain-containing protein n=1 Tax=Ramlibacter sp. AN1015 TaxID=3133428 RepID=UPI0030BC9A4B
MHHLAPIEERIFDDEEHSSPGGLSDEQINDRYVSGEGRILIETNRERLSVFVESLRKPGYIELAPFYQRRERWSVERKSLLIESFIMNIPVPPVFLYEKEFNQYEVMDGQQRISALKDFYEDDFRLTNLEYWPELEGRTYTTLPEKIRAGIDRRSLSSIVLLKESATDDREVSLIRRVVFDRLNRGGVRLERQEIRNALFASDFNQLLHSLAQQEQFREAWKIPLDESQAKRNLMFQKMGDLEVVLRFFALRHADAIEGPLQQFLDNYMFKMQASTPADLSLLHDVFTDVMHVAAEIYGEHLFRPWDADTRQWASAPNKGFADCVLTGISWNLRKRNVLLAQRELVLTRTKELFERHEPGTFTGRKSTKRDLLDRLRLYREMLAEV